MKKYWLSRFKDHEKWTLNKSQASEQHGGQNIGPFDSYESAKAEQSRLNRLIQAAKDLLKSLTKG